MRKTGVAVICLLIYVFTVLWFTVLQRSVGQHSVQFELFWSYRRWLAGDTELGREILANTAMFIPLGFLLSLLVSGSRDLRLRWGRAAIVAVTAILFSLTIEVLQLHSLRGLFEWDDLVSNTLGAVLGLALYVLLRRLIRDRKSFSVVAALISLAIVLVCAAVYLSGRDPAGEKADISSKVYCFQVDEASLSGSDLTLSGFAFLYGRQPSGMTVLLQPEQGRRVELATNCGGARPDANEYFLCEYDYTNTGFTTTGRVDPEQEYEILVRWRGVGTLSTGAYITGERLHYAPDASFAPPETENAPDLKEIIEHGTLRVWRPDCHCWVYQLRQSLYWIADAEFNFEDDGTTYIQYQLWTTQTWNLPEKRLAHNNLWDNIGGHFEKYELSGDFGPYRVMKRELPTEYSITSIVTGYYKNGAWVWKNYFRPIYETSDPIN